jgi:hypothetical protein
MDHSLTESGCRVAEMNSVELADAFDTMLERLEAMSANSADSQPTPHTNSAPRWRSRGLCSTWPATIRSRDVGELVDRLHDIKHARDRPH